MLTLSGVSCLLSKVKTVPQLTAMSYSAIAFLNVNWIWIWIWNCARSWNDIFRKLFDVHTHAFRIIAKILRYFPVDLCCLICMLIECVIHEHCGCHLEDCWIVDKAKRLLVTSDLNNFQSAMKLEREQRTIKILWKFAHSNHITLWHHTTPHQMQRDSNLIFHLMKNSLVMMILWLFLLTH